MWLKLDKSTVADPTGEDGVVATIANDHKWTTVAHNDNAETAMIICEKIGATPKCLTLMLHKLVTYSSICDSMTKQNLRICLGVPYNGYVNRLMTTASPATTQNDVTTQGVTTQHVVTTQGATTQNDITTQHHVTTQRHVTTQVVTTQQQITTVQATTQDDATTAALPETTGSSSFAWFLGLHSSSCVLAQHSPFLAHQNSIGTSTILMHNTRRARTCS